MASITGVTRGGKTWTPEFIVALDERKCIGCGRCYKVCPRNVFELVDRDDEDFDDDDVEDDYDDDMDDGFSDDTSMVMKLIDAMDCIGCLACSKVCPKKCLSHETVE